MERLCTFVVLHTTPLMKTKYNFETKYFGTSSEGIHLLRNGFNFKTYPFQEVSEVAIKQGKAVKNWMLLLVLGIGSLIASIYYFWRTYLFFAEEGGVFYIEELIIPIVLLVFGLSCSYGALRKSLILEIHLAGKKDHFPIKEIEKKGDLKAFSDFLIQTLGISKVNISRKA